MQENRGRPQQRVELQIKGAKRPSVYWGTRGVRIVVLHYTVQQRWSSNLWEVHCGTELSVKILFLYYSSKCIYVKMFPTNSVEP